MRTPRIPAWLVALPLVLAAAAPSAAVVPGRDGLLVFESNRTGSVGFDIWSGNLDGSGTPTQLTNAAGDDIDPAWSPDGSRIAFSSGRDGNDEIYIMDSDGSDETRITTDAAQDIRPEWSPDGTKIAFTSNRGGDYEVWVMGADGAAPGNISQRPLSDDGEPSWSPDGTEIAFQTSVGVGSIEVLAIPAGGGPARPISEPGGETASEPSWSPNGAFIAMSTPGGTIAASDGSIQRRISSGLSHGSWDPAGAGLVWGSADNGGDIYPFPGFGAGSFSSPAVERHAVVQPRPATTRFAFADGSDSALDPCGVGANCSLTRALEIAEPGDEVRLGPGEYRLVGSGALDGEGTRMTGPATGQAARIVGSTVDFDALGSPALVNVVELRHVELVNEQGSGIKLDAAGALVDRVVVRASGRFGVDADTAPLVRNSYVTTSGASIGALVGTGPMVVRGATLVGIGSEARALTGFFLNLGPMCATRSCAAIALTSTSRPRTSTAEGRIPSSSHIRAFARTT